MTLTDEEIRKHITKELVWDSSIDDSKVKVTVDRGRVTLTGTVPSYSTRNRASDAAFRIRDVSWVDNRLIVKYPPVIPLPNDAYIKKTVVMSLADAPDMDGTSIRVLVEDGRVTLEGSVDEYWKKGEAEQIACKARGVCDLINKLAVVPIQSADDKKTAADIRAAIDRNFNGSSECVSIDVVHGMVTLSGTVSTWSARHAAVTAAEFTRGVIDIVDDIDVCQPS
jgi:osmotically-inducible protein OsmY